MHTLRIAVAVAAVTRRPTAPGRLHGFTSSAGLERSGSLIAFSIDDLALLARGRLLGLFWFCG